jgi:hypothetical protein
MARSSPPDPGNRDYAAYLAWVEEACPSSAHH